MDIKEFPHSTSRYHTRTHVWPSDRPATQGSGPRAPPTHHKQADLVYTVVTSQCILDLFHRLVYNVPNISAGTVLNTLRPRMFTGYLHTVLMAPLCIIGILHFHCDLSGPKLIHSGDQAFYDFPRDYKASFLRTPEKLMTTRML